MSDFSGTAGISGATGTDKLVMTVNIVAADRPVWNGTATSVTVPSTEGGMGILPNHEPVLSVSNEGELKGHGVDGAVHEFRVADGFISFDSNKLTVAVERSTMDFSASVETEISTEES